MGRPTPTAEGGGGDGDVHCCLVLFRVVNGEDGEFDGGGECECGDADKLGEDMAAREEEAEEKEVPGRYGEPRGGGAFTTTDVLIGLGQLPREIRGCVCKGVSVHLTRAMIVLATRASESEVASIRSSRRKVSSGERPFAEQDARNLVTLDKRSLPSSRGSIRPMEPGRNLFINLMSLLIGRERGTFNNCRRNQEGGKDSLAENVTVPKRLCEQPALPLFSRRANGCSANYSGSRCAQLGNAPIR